MKTDYRYGIDRIPDSVQLYRANEGIGIVKKYCTQSIQGGVAGLARKTPQLRSFLICYL